MTGYSFAFGPVNASNLGVILTKFNARYLTRSRSVGAVQWRPIRFTVDLTIDPPIPFV